MCDILEQLIWSAQNGDDDCERASAISTLSIKYLKSGNRRAASVIADFVKDHSIDKDLRLFAYLCLLDVTTCKHEDYPDMASFRFPSDVDWGLVERFASNKGI